jgi:hypothetical protein
LQPTLRLCKKLLMPNRGSWTRLRDRLLEGVGGVGGVGEGGEGRAGVVGGVGVGEEGEEEEEGAEEVGGRATEATMGAVLVPRHGAVTGAGEVPALPLRGGGTHEAVGAGGKVLQVLVSGETLWHCLL